MGQKQCTHREEDCADETTYSRAEVIKDSPHGEGCEIRAHGSDGEHEVEADLDACGRVVTDVGIGALCFEDWLYGSISENDSGREEAIYNSSGDLDCKERQQVA